MALDIYRDERALLKLRRCVWPAAFDVRHAENDIRGHDWGRASPPSPAGNEREVQVGRIVVTEFVSLDGVMEDPGGSENFEHGGWSFAFDRGDEGDKFKLDEVLEAEAQLLGRVTYEGFAAAWPNYTDEVGFADKM